MSKKEDGERQARREAWKIRAREASQVKVREGREERKEETGKVEQGTGYCVG